MLGFPFHTPTKNDREACAIDNVEATPRLADDEPIPDGGNVNGADALPALHDAECADRAIPRRRSL